MTMTTIRLIIRIIINNLYYDDNIFQWGVRSDWVIREASGDPPIWPQVAQSGAPAGDRQDGSERTPPPSPLLGPEQVIDLWGPYCNRKNYLLLLGPEQVTDLWGPYCSPKNYLDPEQVTDLSLL